MYTQIDTLNKQLHELNRNKAIGLLLSLSFLLGALTLNRGFQSDDWIQRELMLNATEGIFYQLNHFYHFLENADARPWWFGQDLNIHFWRPLSATSHYIDYALWPNNALLMHLQSALWYVLLTLLAFLVFEKLFINQNLALVASIVFSLDFSHFANVSWLANRNSIIASCLLLASFYFYLRGRSTHKLSINFLASPALFVLALLASESSLAFLGVILSYELLMRRDHSERSGYQTFSLQCIFWVSAITWLLIYQHFAFGSSGNNFYLNPIGNFIQGAQLIVSKLPVYLFGMLFGLEGFYNVLSPQAKLLSSVLCAFSAFIFLYTFRELFKKNIVIFLGTACTIMMILPNFAAPLDMRYNIFSSFFSAGIIAYLLKLSRTDDSTEIYKRIIFVTLLTIHIAIPLMQWLTSGINDWRQTKPATINQSNNSSLHFLNISHPDSDIFIFNYPNPIDSYYVNKINNSVTKIHILTNSFSQHNVKRVSKDIFIAESESGLVFTKTDVDYFSNQSSLQALLQIDTKYANLTNNDFSEPNKHFYIGEIIPEKHFDVKVLKQNQKGLISKVEFNFKEEAKNPNRIFFRWDTKAQELIAL